MSEQNTTLAAIIAASAIAALIAKSIPDALANASLCIAVMTAFYWKQLRTTNND